MEDARASNLRLLLTKSTEWSYEQELRLVIPGDIPPGQVATFNPYYPNELVEIYLGCRMSDDVKAAIIASARNLNPNVKKDRDRLLSPSL